MDTYIEQAREWNNMVFLPESTSGGDYAKYKENLTSECEDFFSEFESDFITALVEEADFDRNDISILDENHHTSFVDKYLSIEEAMLILDNCDNEETDSGLWEGVDDYEEVIKIRACFSYGSDAWFVLEEIYKNINESIEETMDELCDECDELELSEDDDNFRQEDRLYLDFLQNEELCRTFAAASAIYDQNHQSYNINIIPSGSEHEIETITSWLHNANIKDTRLKLGNRLSDSNYNFNDNFLDIGEELGKTKSENTEFKNLKREQFIYDSVLEKADEDDDGFEYVNNKLEKINSSLSSLKETMNKEKDNESSFIDMLNDFYEKAINNNLSENEKEILLSNRDLNDLSQKEVFRYLSIISPQSAHNLKLNSIPPTLSQSITMALADNNVKEAMSLMEQGSAAAENFNQEIPSLVKNNTELDIEPFAQ